MIAPAPPLRVFAPAKINWGLTIRGRRSDGYHDLDTIFQALDWGDELLCRPLAKAECRIHCDAPGIPLGGDNLIARAWSLLHEAFPDRVGGLEVRLIKRIPAGGGLGGGSSDAAAALVAVDRLNKLRLGLDALVGYAAQLGSDCAFFIRGGTALGAGRGERLRPIANRLPPLWLVLVWPGFGSSTAEAYRRVSPEIFEDEARMTKIVQAIESGELSRMQKLVCNCFSSLVMPLDLRYKELQDHIIRERLLGPMLCGSGSSMFAFADDPVHARKAAQKLRQWFPLSKAVRMRRTGVRVRKDRRADSS